MKKMEDRLERCLEKVVEMLEKNQVGGGGQVQVKEEGASQESEAFLVSFLTYMQVGSACVCVIISGHVYCQSVRTSAASVHARAAVK